MLFFFAISVLIYLSRFLFFQNYALNFMSYLLTYQFSYFKIFKVFKRIYLLIIFLPVSVYFLSLENYIVKVKSVCRHPGDRHLSFSAYNTWWSHLIEILYTGSNLDVFSIVKFCFLSLSLSSLRFHILLVLLSAINNRLRQILLSLFLNI